MKRIFAVGLSLACVFVLLCSCGASSLKTAKLMPYDLKFGMSYEDVIALDPTAAEGSLESAEANDGYVSGLHMAAEKDDSDVISVYYGIENEEGSLFPRWYPHYAYSFNQDRELYEYNIICSLPAADDAEYVYDRFVEYYSQITDAEAVTEEGSGRLSTVFDGEELRISILVESDDGEYLFVLGLHDYTHDLESGK